VTRIHVVSLPHTLLTKDYDWCAYTAKVRRFIDMLDMAGVEAIVYGPDIHDTPGATEYNVIVEEEDRLQWFGDAEWDNTRVFDRWDTEDICWRQTNTRAAKQIRQNWRTGDIVGVIGGLCQKQIIDEIAALGPLVVEWGIGYSGVIPGTHRVFESYAWMHHVAGLTHADDMRMFDAVIPNCYDLDDFTFSDTPGDYLLYMGRPTPRKGLPIIADIAKRTSLPVLMAGQPGEPIPGTEHVGLVTGKRKADLLAGARALLTPTTYLEPFGGVAVEAMLSGTPVIATDYGAFTETVVPGVTGYRARMLKDFMDAIEAITALDRRAVANHAIARYSLDAGARMYGDYLRRVHTLYTDGWYAETISSIPAVRKEA
jgi:glycosyltransferase involved in cell wall biosynthesis